MAIKLLEKSIKYYIDISLSSLACSPKVKMMRIILHEAKFLSLLYVEKKLNPF